MARQALFFALWVGLIVYAFLFAPPDQPDTLSLIQDLSLGNWSGINPLIVALFNLMGVWPLLYSSLVIVDGRSQSVPAWPFAAASFAVGAFALLPYLALRRPNRTFAGQLTWQLRLLDSRWLGVLAAIAVVALASHGLGGDWGDFVQQWQSSRFIHVMSLDFVLLCLLVPALLGDDMARRGASRWFWLAAALPMLGLALYLCLRPSLSPEPLAQPTPVSGSPS
ncbi:MAG: DUF2834 domain-containing protein [Cyanobacteria bacterium P01_A01_bin.135]